MTVAVVDACSGAAADDNDDDDSDDEAVAAAAADGGCDVKLEPVVVGAEAATRGALFVVVCSFGGGF